MHNYSYDDVRVVVCNTVQVSYGSDLDRVGEVLLEVARRNPYGIPGEEHRYQVWSFDDSGITVRVCTWIKDAVDRVPAFQLDQFRDLACVQDARRRNSLSPSGFARDRRSQDGRPGHRIDLFS